MSKRIYVGNLPVKDIEVKNKGVRIHLAAGGSPIDVGYRDQSQRAPIEAAKTLKLAFAPDVPAKAKSQFNTGKGIDDLRGQWVLNGWDEGVRANKAGRGSGADELTLVPGLYGRRPGYLLNVKHLINEGAKI